MYSLFTKLLIIFIIFLMSAVTHAHYIGYKKILHLYNIKNLTNYAFFTITLNATCEKFKISSFHETTIPVEFDKETEIICKIIVKDKPDCGINLTLKHGHKIIEANSFGNCGFFAVAFTETQRIGKLFINYSATHF